MDREIEDLKKRLAEMTGGGLQQRNHHEAHAGRAELTLLRARQACRSCCTPWSADCASPIHSTPSASCCSIPSMKCGICWSRAAKRPEGVQADFLRRFVGRPRAAACGPCTNPGLGPYDGRRPSPVVYRACRISRARRLGAAAAQGNRATGALCFGSRDPTRFNAPPWDGFFPLSALGCGGRGVHRGTP